MPKTTPEDQPNDFSQHINRPPQSFLGEFVEFLIHNKKWWLMPIALMLLLAGLVAFLSSSPVAAPFIYPAS